MKMIFLYRWYTIGQVQYLVVTASVIDLVRIVIDEKVMRNEKILFREWFLEMKPAGTRSINLFVDVSDYIILQLQMRVYNFHEQHFQ